MPNNSKSIVLTGGGSAGHVMPNLALVDELTRQDWTIHYIGSQGVEKQLVTNAGINFYEIQSGKLRRYFSWQNFVDAFRIPLGLWQAWRVLGKIKPNIVFSKGGYVSVPVAMAAWMRCIPVVSHESDLTPGLANRIISRFSRQILYSFPETAKYLSKKDFYVGTPIRPLMLAGEANRGAKYLGFVNKGEKPLILVVGGSLGAVRLNNGLVECLPILMEKYCVVHITGPGKTIHFTHPHYRDYPFLGAEFADIVAFSDMVVSRAGANSIFEFVAVHKPMLLVPLEIGSRGDQVDNAKSFEKNGWAYLLSEKNLQPEVFISAIEKTMRDRAIIINNQKKYSASNVAQTIVATLTKIARV